MNQEIINVLIDRTQEGTPVVTSRVIAEQLGKRHDHVIRDLEVILENPNLGSLIIPSDYSVEGQSRSYKQYLLTKDGFILYMFNIQGHNEFKMAYINKFNEMTDVIKNADVVEIMRGQHKDRVICTVLTLMVEVKELEEEIVELNEEIQVLEEIVEEKDLVIAEKEKEVKSMEELLQSVADETPIAEKRQRVNQIVRSVKNHGDIKLTIAKRFEMLYAEFGRLHHKNINLQAKKHKITQIEYIDTHMNKIDELYKLCLKMFKSDIDRLSEEFFGIIIAEGEKEDRAELEKIIDKA